MNLADQLTAALAEMADSRPQSRRDIVVAALEAALREAREIKREAAPTALAADALPADWRWDGPHAAVKIGSARAAVLDDGYVVSTRDDVVVSIPVAVLRALLARAGKVSP